MDALDQEKAINNFLGSAHLFASAVSRMLEGRIWGEIAGLILTVAMAVILTGREFSKTARNRNDQS